jgi:hypothetical protein
MRYSLSIHDTYIQQATKKLVGQQDDLIRRAMVDVIGEALLPQEMMNRCALQRIIGESWQTLYIDGEPVLMLFDLEFPESERLEDRWVCRVSQRYKYVGRAAHLNNLALPKE